MTSSSRADVVIRPYGITEGRAVSTPFLLVNENHQLCWWFQKALAMPNPAAAESLPCVRGGVTALSRDGGVVLVVTIPQSPLCGDSPLYTRGP